MNEAVTRAGVGPGVDGRWVNNNHACKCGRRLPLPRWEDRYCPDCGTRQPGPKMRAEAEEKKRKRMKVCPMCLLINDSKANFCTECGTKLPILDSLVKEKGDAITK